MHKKPSFNERDGRKGYAHAMPRFRDGPTIDLSKRTTSNYLMTGQVFVRSWHRSIPFYHIGDQIPGELRVLFFATRRWVISGQPWRSLRSQGFPPAALTIARMQALIASGRLGHPP